MRVRLYQGLHLSVLLAGMAILAGCEESCNTYVAPPPPPVRVAQPVQQPVTLYFELNGNTAPLNSVDIEARVRGYVQSID
ncbi:efflux transporter periplasmic adaptor subunit, partial [Rhizobium ruizarguesonis]